MIYVNLIPVFLAEELPSIVLNWDEKDKTYNFLCKAVDGHYNGSLEYAAKMALRFEVNKEIQAPVLMGAFKQSDELHLYYLCLIDGKVDKGLLLSTKKLLSFEDIKMLRTTDFVEPDKDFMYANFERITVISMNAIAAKRMVQVVEHEK